MAIQKPPKKILTVEYNPVLDKYYIPSKSRKDKIPKWEVFESRSIIDKKTGLLKWFCNCENFCITRKYEGECKHIKKAKFYKRNHYHEKHIVIRERD